ncbi:hypothetical protein SARC_00898 [Sphaeroforma arctica JP610]|uniref:DNA endonuclease activator Ctp1 C-terminal domain-containing protein n=1 Tax=Sphaeroforma arctica JP610 TaxID=667725 RepID=A0A0L0GD55_9EUKA|nr:hypothetical protein SARC_00898 [Sphaeroforma arctica JP610]KNC86947.1 hypothetical protein SARC_00898 [Sphaeroforma arctica JP610]|eukprot:XP_014160849.1 hypothetical protein SARC_00898 [Sphaeroforma arctica JP610]
MAEEAITKLQASVLKMMNDQSEQYELKLDSNIESGNSTQQQIRELSNRIIILEADKDGLLSRLESKARHIEELEATLAERTTQYRNANTRAIKYSTMLLNVTGKGKASISADDLQLGRWRNGTAADTPRSNNDSSSITKESGSEYQRISGNKNVDNQAIFGHRNQTGTAARISAPGESMDIRRVDWDVHGNGKSPSGALIIPAPIDEITNHSRQDGQNSSELASVPVSREQSDPFSRSNAAKKSISIRHAHLDVRRRSQSHGKDTCEVNVVEDKSRTYNSTKQGFNRFQKSVGTIALRKQSIHDTDNSATNPQDSGTVIQFEAESKASQLDVAEKNVPKDDGGTEECNFNCPQVLRQHAHEDQPKGMRRSGRPGRGPIKIDGRNNKKLTSGVSDPKAWLFSKEDTKISVERNALEIRTSIADTGVQKESLAHVRHDASGSPDEVGFPRLQPGDPLNVSNGTNSDPESHHDAIPGTNKHGQQPNDGEEYANTKQQKKKRTRSTTNERDGDMQSQPTALKLTSKQDQPKSMDSQLKGFLEHKRKIEEDERSKRPHKYIEVVRGKDKRAKLKGYDCDHCRRFHELAGGQLTAQQRIQLTSKHRHTSSPVKTPPGIWAMTFDTTYTDPPDTDSMSQIP